MTFSLFHHLLEEILQRLMSSESTCGLPASFTIKVVNSAND